MRASPLNTSTVPALSLVLCRHDEDVRWALSLASSSIEVVVYNNGAPLGVPEEIAIPNVGREAFCYVQHIRNLQQRAASCGVHCVPNATIFTQAQPSCSKELDGTHAGGKAAPVCTAHVRWQALLLSRGLARLAPRGFVDLDPGHKIAFTRSSWIRRPSRAADGSIYYNSRACWKDSWLRLLRGGDAPPNRAAPPSRAAEAFFERPLLYYSPTAQFAVSREQLLGTPAGWLRRASEALEDSRALPWAEEGASAAANGAARALDAADGTHRASVDAERVCCDEGKRHTCLPWVLERFWHVLLGGARPGTHGSAASGHAGRPWAHGSWAERFALAEHGALAGFTDSMSAPEYSAFITAVDGDQNGAERLRRASLTWSAQQRLSDLGRWEPFVSQGKHRREFWRHSTGRLRREVDERCRELSSSVSALRAALPRLVLLQPPDEAALGAAGREQLPHAPLSEVYRRCAHSSPACARRLSSALPAAVRKFYRACALHEVDRLRENRSAINVAAAAALLASPRSPLAASRPRAINTGRYR